jgi:hypothetical protein
MGTNNNEALRAPDGQRLAARLLAIQVQSLREVTRENDESVEGFLLRNELRKATAQLAGLVTVPENVKFIVFEFRAAKTDGNDSERIFGRKQVEVRNRHAAPDAHERGVVSLLPSDAIREDLPDYGVSEVLPPARGGI